MKRCVIISGADIGNHEYLKEAISEEDHIIFCDSRLRHMDKLSVNGECDVGIRCANL